MISIKRWDKDGNPLGQDQGGEAPSAVVEASKVVVDYDQLERRDGLMYFEEKPFTGVALKKHENGQKERETTFRDGKRDGLLTDWRKNGQKDRETTFKDGRYDGLRTKWHENGQKKEESVYQNRKRISSKYWDEDGNRTE